MTERDLLVDCLHRLNAFRRPYMLTGSMASNYWGVPRSTHDLDFVITLEPESAAELVRLFDDGFFLDVDAVRGIFAPPHMFNAIDRRSALKVDFWLLRREPFEQNMFRRRVPVTLFGEAAWIPTAEDILLHKLHWHMITPSERQLGDAAGIVAVQGADLDRHYLESWSGRLGLDALLADLFAGRIRPKNT